MKELKILLVILSTIVVGNAFAERFSVNVGQFEKLKINGNLKVVYKNLSDSTGFASYEAPADSGEIFKFTNKNEGNLKVEPSDEKWGLTDLPTLYLYSDFLTSLESFSEESIDVVSVSPCASFNVTQVGNGSISVENLKSNNVTAAITTGNGSIYLTGSCINANYRMVGAGLISADQLQAENVKCRILGTGSIGCWPVDNLNVTGLGSTKIYYKGSPNIKKTGGGKLFELPDEIDEDSYANLGTPVPSLDQPAPTVVEEEDEAQEEDEDEDDEEDNFQTVVTEDD